MASPVGAQLPRIDIGPSLVLPASAAEDRTRLDQLFGAGAAHTPDFLIRSASTLSAIPASATGELRVALIAPEMDVIGNSALPFSMNDGPLWAGRGLNTLVTTGVTARWGRFTAILAPQFWSAENRDFQVIQHLPTVSDGRSPWSNPFHPWPSSIDLPYRFGDQRLSGVDPGQSSLSADLGRVVAGAGTENMWWGPGAQNAIVMSNNAPGFPHAFVRTGADGWRTGVGRFDAQWVLGTLRESDFFDSTSSNNTRSLSGLVVVWTPAADSSLSVGMARTVWANTTASVPLGAALDVLRGVGRPDTDSSATPAQGRRDQILSFFGRWIFPQAGFEAYAEWARFEQPASLADFIEYPQHSQAYTVGLQWGHPLRVRGEDARLRVQAEGTYLEPDPAQRVRPVGTTYTSRVVPQGYTNRGQSLGAAIGPGSSSQWLAVDLFAPRYTIGAYLERIRFDNATVWTSIVPEPKSEDLSLIGGLRASVTWRGARLAVDFAHNTRLDYLFQDRPNANDPYHKGVDIENNTVGVKLTTAVVR
ncbi:MAG TPA: capsule assembly Wzi family protein [Gemmatimonadaceae bacterium]|nr:capsule assembly Wzi family protein [Gemmatimonadaceae bacterium]